MIINANFFNYVITRIDYEDQIVIEDYKVLLIKQICLKYGIKNFTSRKLDLNRDFSTNDSQPFRDLAEEYVDSVLCKLFFDDNDKILIQVNQFFIQVIQTNTDEYKSYHESHLPIIMDIYKVLDIPVEQLIRISLKKADEVFYDSITTMSKYFRYEFIQNNIFGEKQNWNVPQSESLLQQNFMYDNFRVNFRSYLDRGINRIENNSGKIEDKVLYRLILEYEVYERYEIDHIEDVLNDMNTVTEELFLKSFSEEGRKIALGKGEYENYVIEGKR